MKARRTLTGLLVMVLVLSVMALTACGGSPLVGKWLLAEDEEHYIEFFDDGKMEMGDESYTFGCTYEETGEKEITVTLLAVNGEEQANDEPFVLEYSISGNELTLDDGEGVGTFKRKE
jgi:hypothetical protein